MPGAATVCSALRPCPVAKMDGNERRRGPGCFAYCVLNLFDWLKGQGEARRGQDPCVAAAENSASNKRRRKVVSPPFSHTTPHNSLKPKGRNLPQLLLSFSSPPPWPQIFPGSHFNGKKTTKSQINNSTLRCQRENATERRRRSRSPSRSRRSNIIIAHNNTEEPPKEQPSTIVSYFVALHLLFIVLSSLALALALGFSQEFSLFVQKVTALDFNC